MTATLVVKQGREEGPGSVIIPLPRANSVPDQHASTVDKKSCRQSSHIVTLAERTIEVEQGRKMQLLLLHKTGGIFSALLQIHRPQHKGPRPECSIELLHHWHFVATWVAPGRLKIYKNHGTTLLLESELTSRHIRQLKICCCN